MKKIHIILLVLVAAGVAFIVSSFGDYSSYQTFASASAKPGKKLYVIGYLQKDKEMVYDPKVDPNHFIFYAKDKEGGVHKVVFNGEKPRDIEKSEQIVMMGYEDAGTFHCSRIQMKCPSKYKKDMVAEGKSS
jgi:cytochrome c-type biogenesis protein CcmE